MKKKTQNIFLAASLLVIMLGFLWHALYVVRFNAAEHSYSFAESQDENMNCQMVQRNGSSGSWIKRVETDTGMVQYLGTIYDITVANTSEYTVSLWNLRINIPEDCFLNSGWCGKVEIHQNANSAESVQTLDLRNDSIDSITLTHQVMDQDLMIPLSAGDYLIYYADNSADEYPIGSSTESNANSTVIGLIVYSTDTNPATIVPEQLNYRLEVRYTKGFAFVGLLVALFVWTIACAMVIATRLSMKRARIRFDQDDQIIHQSISVFNQFFEAKDEYTSGHSQRVAKYSRLIAQELGFSEDTCRRVYYIALMHDCGKCYIPDGILKKPGKLTEEEYRIIQSHTVKGANMVKDFTSIEHIRDGVLYHHERYDGKGYPEGLKGENIPLIGRIICISDSFDAMNSSRCYREKLSQNQILDELKNNAGKQFDPKLVEIFLRLIDKGEIVLSK